MDKQLEKTILENYPEGLTWQKTIPAFHPETDTEASEIFKLAHKYRQKLFISGFGNNIDPIGDKFHDILVIKTDRLNQIIEIGASDFYITVGSGYPLKEINRELAGQKLCFPFSDTNYAGSAGGAVAIGLTGTDNHHDLPLSRYLLEARAVLPNGDIVSPGAKTFKSVSGYDASRLFFNSWGLLGLIISITLRIQPIVKKDEIGLPLLNQITRRPLEEALKGSDDLGKLITELKNQFDPDQILPLI